MGNVFCMNSNCKHYYEDSCMVNLNGKTVDIGVDGKCESFEAGVHFGYTEEAAEGADNGVDASALARVCRGEFKQLKGEVYQYV